MTADALPDSHMARTWQHGDDPCALLLTERPVTPPGPGEVLVRNAVIGLNPVDWKVLGGDGAGPVIAVGADVPAAGHGHRVVGQI